MIGFTKQVGTSFQLKKSTHKMWAAFVIEKKCLNIIFLVKKNKNYFFFFIFLLVMPKYLGKENFSLGSFPEVGQKQKT